MNMDNMNDMKGMGNMDMSGMKGAKGTIVAVTDGPAYMVDYTSNDDSKMKVTNHKWLSQSDLKSLY